jgi:MarR family transcriptional regulator, organic hydroperoxide resistance regulator
VGRLRSIQDKSSMRAGEIPGIGWGPCIILCVFAWPGIAPCSGADRSALKIQPDSTPPASGKPCRVPAASKRRIAILVPFNAENAGFVAGTPSPQKCLANMQTSLAKGFPMESRVTFELLQAARAYRLRSAKLLSRVGLYPGQDALLKLLDDRGRLTMGEAAAALSIQPPTVTKMVNRLSAAQLVKTEVMGDDRRKISVSLTDSARAKIEEIDTIWEQLETLALDSMDPQPLRTQLSAITHNLSQNGARAPNGAMPLVDSVSD